MGIKLEDLLAKGYRLANECVMPTDKTMHLLPKPKKRIRQNTKPLSNKLETEFGNYLHSVNWAGWRIYEQAITLTLANGLRYTPDWVVCSASGLRCYEIKGKHVWDDAIAKLKMAASVYPMWTWYLVWKESDGWKHQKVLP